MISSPKTLPECWGHRGACPTATITPFLPTNIQASAAFPENTLASFEAAIRDGAEGIESDVHVSKDDVVLMFHDPSLERTTDSTGEIRDRNWHGEDGMEHVRTIKEPRQSIPTFEETIKLLMRPENQRVKFNVDVKVQNDPDRLFRLMHDQISQQRDWETVLAPRILLGLWHPRFIAFAKARLPYCRRSYIGNSTYIARKYFWKDCHTFSMAFGSLTTADGERFRKECKTAGKNLMVWTVNLPDHMMEAVRWEVSVIITDVTRTWLGLRADLQIDYEKTRSQYGRSFLWTTYRYYTPAIAYYSNIARKYLETVGGPFDDFVGPQLVETNS